jgi:hypothetical protein
MKQLNIEAGDAVASTALSYIDAASNWLKNVPEIGDVIGYAQEGTDALAGALGVPTNWDPNDAAFRVAKAALDAGGYDTSGLEEEGGGIDWDSLTPEQKWIVQQEIDHPIKGVDPQLVANSFANENQTRHLIDKQIADAEAESAESGSGIKPSKKEQSIPREAKERTMKKTHRKKVHELNGNEIENEMKGTKGFLGVFSHDEAAKLNLMKLAKKKFSMIINLDSLLPGHHGTHWVCAFFDPKFNIEGFHRIEYFDSFGMPPSDDIGLMLNTSGCPIWYNRTQYQEDHSIECGYYAIFYIKGRMMGKSPSRVLDELTQKPSEHNEELVYEEDYE